MVTILVLFVFYRLFSMDIFAVTHNDSFHYLDDATSSKFLVNPVSIFQPKDYKFAGYSLFITTIYGLSHIIDTGPLLLIVLCQRVLLALSLFWVIRLLRFWSLPLVLFLSSAPFIAQSNYLYTEGMTTPLALLFGLCLLSLWEKVEEGDEKRIISLLLMFFLIVFYLLLMLIKINFVLLSCPCLIFLLKRREVSSLFWRKFLLIVVMTILGSTLCYMGSVSYSNYKTYNRFTPMIGSERIFYWAAWTHLFILNEENQNRSELAEFWDNGSPYKFIHGTEKNCGSYYNFSCTLPLFQKRTEELVAASSLSLSFARLRSFFCALLGGEKQEQEGIRQLIAEANGTSPFDNQKWAMGWYPEYFGLEAFNDRFNNGKEGQIIRGLQSESITISPYRTYQAIFSAVIFILSFVMLLLRRISFFSPATLGLASYLFLSACFGFYLVDVWRYVIPGWCFFVLLQIHGYRHSFTLKP